MAVLIASDLSKNMAGNPLMRSVSFKLERRERLTLSGRNGAGKTTLLRMLAGEAGLDGGELSFEKGARVALHDQRPPRERGLTLREYVLSGCVELVGIEGELARLEEAMAGGAHDDSTLGAYARAQERLEHAGGYRWREEAMTTLRGLGFADADLDRRLDTFSGGELTRGSLARALAARPDLLLLDEPTNHLDVAALEWLEQHLAALDAAIVLVAHDRWFLEAVGTAVLELEGGRARFFAGPWHAWRQERAARELAAGRAAERQRAEIERLERFVTRFRAGTRARQAQARAKKLDRIERIEVDPRGGKALAFAFKPPARSGRVVFELEHATLRAGEKTLLEDAELWLERGERVSLVGPNGAGKTTLIETLAARREPAAGRLRQGHNVRLGYLSQHGDELGDGQGSVLEATQRATGLKPNPARTLLGRFLFSGEQAEKPLAGLSGGERRRLSLAVLVASGANVLILDEPTNHLDLESREALEDALRRFEGSLLLISHDRALLDAVGSRTVAFEDRGLRSYAGGWAEYVRVRDERVAASRATPRPGSARPKPRSGSSAPASSPPPPPGKRRARASSSRGVARAPRAVRALEGEIEVAEARLAALERELADPALWSEPGRAMDASSRHAGAKREVDALYARLEAAASEPVGQASVDSKR